MSPEGTKAPTCLSVALDYIEAGINVTPIHGRNAQGENVTDPGKQPKLKGWQKRTLTKEQFERKFDDGDNIGVITGKASGLIVVDCDRRNGGMDWYEANKDNLSNCIQETTPNGGIHIYYRYPKDRELVESTGGLFQGVDFLADGGKQVVTWPSVGSSGDMYRIENGLTLIDVQYEADEPPSWIIDAADYAAMQRKEASELSITVTLDTSVKWNHPSDLERAREVLRHYPPAVQGKQGDYTTLRAATRCRDFLITEPMAFKLMKEIYNLRCSPPWDEKGLKAKVSHAYKYAKLPPGKDSIQNQFNDESPTEELKAIEAKEEESKAKGKYVLTKPIQCARRYVKHNEGKVLCDQNQIYLYDTTGHNWSMVDDEYFEAIMLRELNRESAALAEKAKIDQLRSIRIGVKRELEGLYRSIRTDSWTDDSKTGEFIALQNGILNIQNGELVPHSPDWFSFTTLPFSHNPNASCPQFMAFLDSVWDDDEEIKRALQLWMGYILISPLDEQKFAVFIGASRAGKGTITRVMEAMVGKQNTVGCDMMQFGDVFGLEPVIGKKLVVFSEVEKAAGKEIIVATERIKRITGKDTITVNRKNKGMVNVTFSTKIVLICNAIPNFVNANNSLTNRMIVFPFNKSFFGKEDRQLDAKLESELPGIFNWAMEGARALLAGQRLTQPEAGARKIEEISEVLDNVKGFISDAVTFTDDQSAFVSCAALFDSYKTWCRESNYNAHGKKRFFQEFKGKTGNRVTTGQRREGLGVARGYFGLKLDSEFLGGHEFSDTSAPDYGEPPF